MSDPVDQGRQIRFLGAQLVHDGFDLEADFSPEKVMSGAVGPETLLSGGGGFCASPAAASKIDGIAPASRDPR